MSLKFLLSAVILLFVAGLTGCASNDQAISESLRLIFDKKTQKLATAQQLDSAYKYLYVTKDGQSSLLVLGHSDVDRISGGVVDSWYTSQAETLKIKNGRIVALTGTPFDWLAVRFVAEPTWDWLLRAPQNDVVQFTRERDVAHNYQMGIVEKVTIRRIAKPLNHSFQRVGEKNLTWFQESYQPNNLPDSIFAVDAGAGVSEQTRVIYSWQCLSVDVCLTMQAWGSSEQAAMAASLRPP
jgi:hypothetical protein